MLKAAERTYRGKPSWPIPVWNGVLEHRERIVSAIWEFLWCLDRVTLERDGVGIVLGGMPIKAATVADDLQESIRSARAHLQHLEDKRYITRRLTPHGYSIGVLNSKKFGIWKSQHAAESCRPGGRILPASRRKAADLAAGNCRRNKDAAVDPALDAAAEAETARAWTAFGLEPCGDLKFRDFVQTTFANRNGEAVSKTMGSMADLWQAAGGTVPGPYFAALKQLRDTELKAGRGTQAQMLTYRDIVPKER
jgi:hypothetical protein